MGDIGNQNPILYALQEDNHLKEIEEWEFEKSYKNNKCSVSGAELNSASSTSDDPALLHVTIRYIPKVQLAATE